MNSFASHSPSPICGIESLYQPYVFTLGLVFEQLINLLKHGPGIDELQFRFTFFRRKNMSFTSSETLETFFLTIAILIGPYLSPQISSRNPLCKHRLPDRKGCS